MQLGYLWRGWSISRSILYTIFLFILFILYTILFLFFLYTILSMSVKVGQQLLGLLDNDFAAHQLVPALRAAKETSQLVSLRWKHWKLRKIKKRN